MSTTPPALMPALLTPEAIMIPETSQEPTAPEASPDPVSSPEAAEASAAPDRRKRLLRMGLLVLLLGGLFALASATGVLNDIDPERIRQIVAAAGWWGFALYLALFTLGILVQIPGMMFVAAAIVAYGQVSGGVLGLVGAMVATSINFWIVRGVGGRSLDALPIKPMRKILDRLQTSPVQTVVLLRTLFMLAPLLNYALALSNVRFRDFFVGSFLGLLGPIALATIFFDFFFNLFFG